MEHPHNLLSNEGQDLDQQVQVSSLLVGHKPSKASRKIYVRHINETLCCKH